MSKVTIYDIAKALSVNASTVNRAINGKPGVSEKKRRIILDYAQKHGYKVNQAAKSLNRTLKFAYLMKKTISAFDEQVIEGIKAAHAEIEGYNVSLDVLTADTNQEYLNTLTSIKESGSYNAVILQPVKSKEIEDLCASLMDAGIPVATVVSDIDNSSRLFTVHLNGFIAGSTAAELLWFSGCTKTAYFCGDPEFKIHREMINGFEHFADSHDVQITNIYNDNADPEKARENCLDMLSSDSDVQGVFIGTANSIPICEEIAASGKNIRIISMDVFKDIIRFIKKGIISASLYQQPEKQGYTAVQNMYKYLQSGKSPSDKIIVPEIVIQSNLNKFNEFI